MDFIFLIGPSAVVKTTRAKALYQHYKETFAPSFGYPYELPNEANDLSWVQSRQKPTP